MWFWYEENSDLRSHSWKRPGQDGIREDQSHKGMENSNKGQGYGEFPQICKLLSTLYPELQPYSKTVKQTKGQKEMEIG